VLRTGQALLAKPESETELAALGVVQSIGSPSVDWLGVPLKLADRTVGVLAVQTYTAGVRYDERHKEILQYVSTQIAAAIERTRAEQALRASETRLKAVLHSALDAHVTMDDTGLVTSADPPPTARRMRRVCAASSPPVKGPSSTSASSSPRCVATAPSSR
jgi:transcriptional regulator with GAF, ATPase, and Fis domain